MSKEPEYELLIQFEDQSASFVHGFEAGTIYGRMKETRHVIEETVHTANADLFSQMAAREGYAIELKPIGDDGEWMTLDAKRHYTEVG